MLYIEKFYSKDFRDKSSKEAYLKACKFVATNILSKGSKVEVSKVTWDIIRVDNQKGDLPTFRLSLYYKFDDTEFKKQTCNACKEFHKSFFINSDFNCSRCNKIGYEKNIQEKLLVASEYFKRVLDNELNGL
jgi:hypothetical protein